MTTWLIVRKTGRGWKAQCNYPYHDPRIPAFSGFIGTFVEAIKWTRAHQVAHLGCHCYNRLDCVNKHCNRHSWKPM